MGFIVCLSGRARKLKRQKVVYCLFIRQGHGILKERQKVVYCLYIPQGQEI